MARKIRYDSRLDYYVVLGVAATASGEEIQRVYRQRAKQVHPDLHPEDPEHAKQQFQILNEAYDVLSDQQLRWIYDQLRRQSLGIRDIPPFTDPLADKYAPRNYNFSRGSQYSYTTDVWRAAWQNILRSPSHRLSIGITVMVIIAVLIFNLFTRLLAPTFEAIRNRSATTQAQALQTLMPQPIAAQPTFDYIPERPTPATPVFAVCTDHIQISEPADGSEINGETFNIRGTADDPDLHNYRIEIDSVSSGSRWILRLPATIAVTDGVLLENISIGNFPTGYYILRLRVQRSDETFAPPCEVQIRRKR
ncbi:MAG: DnaJ domain-containing protein [Anaerolineae bacterium]|nr:DnaJ domain-containing protein [Anaerolineae bacterium]